MSGAGRGEPAGSYDPIGATARAASAARGPRGSIRGDHLAFVLGHAEHGVEYAIGQGSAVMDATVHAGRRAGDVREGVDRVRRQAQRGTVDWTRNGGRPNPNGRSAYAADVDPMGGE